MLKVLSLLKVSDVKTLVSILYPEATNPHSKYVQLQKQLNVLVATGKLKRGTGYYALPEYGGNYPSHEKTRTQILAELVRRKLPISVFLEHSLPIQIRPDIIALIGKPPLATLAVIEICHTEKIEYLNHKEVALRNWKEAPEYFSQLFGTPIPCFTLVSYGLTHPNMTPYKTFLEEL